MNLFHKADLPPDPEGQEDPWGKKDEWDARWAKQWGDSPDSIPNRPSDEEISKSTYPFPLRTSQGLICALPFLGGIGLILFASIWLILNAAFHSFFQSKTYWITICVLILFAGVLLLLAGILGIRSYLRFFKYLKKIGSRTSVSVSELVLPERREPEKIRTDIKKFIRSGYFPEGHLSEDEDMLYLTEDAFENR